MPRDNNDDDRPKKSWREIDQSREKGAGSRSGTQGPSPRHERSQAYRSYKTQLNKLFDGGGVLPEALQTKLGDSGVASDAKARKEALAALAAAATPKALRAALQAFEAAHGFPEDEEVLAKIIDLGGEAMVLKAIETLAALQREGRLKRAASLKARLKTAHMTHDDPDLRSAAAELLGKL